MSTLGADPEVVILNGKTNQPVPAHYFGFPHKLVPELVQDGKILRDGYMVELNPEANYCRYVVNQRIWRNLAQADKLKQIFKSGFKLVGASAVEIDLTDAENWPLDSCEFGCEGSWNGYTGVNGGPHIEGRTHPLRYAGFHIHVSQPEPAEVEWAEVPANVFLWARMCDRYAGLLNTYLVGNPGAGLRRKYYGQAGEFRFQMHPKSVAALEYRTLGAETISHPALSSLMFGLVRLCYEEFERLAQHYDTTYEKQVQAAINAGVSDDGLLDLIPALPGWYNTRILRTAKSFFSTGMHNNLLLWTGEYSKEGYVAGWGEWCQQFHFNHYREDSPPELLSGGEKGVIA